MLLQDQTLPFNYTFGVPMTFYWIVIFIFGILLISTKSLTKKLRILIFSFTLILGIIFGGVPNPVMPIQQTLIALGLKQDLSFLIPAWIILSIIILTSFLVGRVFCGYACPLGTLQELLSLINFKSDVKHRKKAKFRIDISTKFAIFVRWSFVGVIFISAILFSYVFLPDINPFTGFSSIQNINFFIITIPFLSLALVSLSSVFLYRPWCRFLCPFGAGSAAFGRFARDKYVRTEACTDCKLCEQICPTQEAAVDSKKGECYYCNRCLDICPHGAIKFTLE